MNVSARALRADIIVVGASLGGVAAALAALQRGRSVILTEETRWIGGQATTQGVPLDEHPWSESFGITRNYARFREGVRDHYRRNYPLSRAASADPLLNPGAGWVSKLCFEPRVGLSVLYDMLDPFISAGRLRVLTEHSPTAVETDGDYVRAVTLRDHRSDHPLILHGDYFLDATELGDLLELGDVESVIGAESREETGEPLAAEGSADASDQMVFTHVFALEHRAGEHHVIDKPEGYDEWLSAKSHRGDFPKFTLPDLLGARHDHFGRPIDGQRYNPSTWNFRRILCAGNFEPGTMESDLSVAIWPINEYNRGVLCGGTAEDRQGHLDAARDLSLSVIYWLQTDAPNPATGNTGYPGLRPRGDVFGTEDGLAQAPYIRESRRIRAEFTVREQDFRIDLPATCDGPVHYPDSVGLSGYRVDIHKPVAPGQPSITLAMHGKHWVQQIPLGALVPVRVENLIPACKNLGVTHIMNGAFRVHATEWNIGEAAGALAAYCIDRRTRPREVRHRASAVVDFQQSLRAQGVELEWRKLAPAQSYHSYHRHTVGDEADFYFGEAWRR